MSCSGDAHWGIGRILAVPLICHVILSGIMFRWDWLVVLYSSAWQLFVRTIQMRLVSHVHSMNSYFGGLGLSLRYQQSRVEVNLWFHNRWWHVGMAPKYILSRSLDLLLRTSNHQLPHLKYLFSSTPDWATNQFVFNGVEGYHVGCNSSASQRPERVMHRCAFLQPHPSPSLVASSHPTSNFFLIVPSCLEMQLLLHSFHQTLVSCGL